MNSIIYTITNPIGEVYVGSTKNKFNARISEHKHNVKRKRKGKIYDSFNKYGFKNHTFKVIQNTNEEDRLELEHYIIQTFEPKLNISKSYNATALGKIWVNANGKEFQVYKEQILPTYKIGRLNKKNKNI